MPHTSLEETQMAVDFKKVGMTLHDKFNEQASCIVERTGQSVKLHLGREDDHAPFMYIRYNLKGERDYTYIGNLGSSGGSGFDDSRKDILANAMLNASSSKASGTGGFVKQFAAECGVVDSKSGRQFDRDLIDAAAARDLKHKSTAIEAIALVHIKMAETPFELAA